MRRNRSLPALPHLLPRRIRLVKLLRAHGLRDAERLREDELLGALSKLKIVLPSAAPIVFGAALPSSGANSASVDATASDTPDETAEDAEDLYDDPHALERFREPKVFIPANERTFLRLIAVDPQTLFVTWDLNRDAHSLIAGRVFVDLVRLDKDAPHQRTFVDLAPGGWYLGAPDAGATVLARLGCESESGDRVLVESNAAIVLPNRPQEGGEVIFATIPSKTDRRTLVGGKLLDATAAEEAGIVVNHTGEAATLPLGERVVEEPVSHPFSAERAGRRESVNVTKRSSTGLPTSSTLPGSQTMPSRGQ